jgi:hypothetical protein
MPEVVTRGLRHITSVSNALLIAETGVFHSGCKAQSYDGGMNFLGVLGENSNTQPRERGAELLCSWIGKVSAPLLWDEPVTHEENKLRCPRNRQQQQHPKSKRPPLGGLGSLRRGALGG